MKNIALIDDIEVEFSKGLNILTGETGAGKSILLGAVDLALGKKMNSEVIGNFGDYALVELVFLIENEELLKELAKHEVICEDGQLILSRKVMDGRSICKINSETCTTSQLKTIASLLLAIHGQQEHHKLLSSEQQLLILDTFASDKITRLKAETAREYEQLIKLQAEARDYQIDEEGRAREVALLEFEVNEINEAQLKVQEDVNLEKIYQRLINSKRIAEGLMSAYNLTGGEGQRTASELISSAIREVSNVKSYDDNLDNICKMIVDIEGMLSDYNREVSSYLQNITFSAEDFNETESRLNLINGLKSKYGSSIEEILAYQEVQAARLAQLSDFDKLKVQMEEKVKEQEGILETLCDELSSIRKSNAEEFTRQLIASLQDLNFNAVDFEIVFTKLEHFSRKGQDQVEFMISTNPGEAKRPLGKVVSGGELSRIMLGVKTLIADNEEAQTQIFDEIDAGISGRTAQKVAEKMRIIANRRQVICITHLPQIAAMANAHYEIVKNVTNNVTKTQISKLDEGGEVEELARMLGGAEITQSARDNAREMKNLAQSTR